MSQFRETSRRDVRDNKWPGNCLLIRLLDCEGALTRRCPIRVFGVSLLAVAAVAAASLLWKRRQEELRAYFESDEHRLDDLRTAGL